MTRDSDKYSQGRPASVDDAQTLVSVRLGSLGRFKSAPIVRSVAKRTIFRSATSTERNCFLTSCVEPISVCIFNAKGTGDKSGAIISNADLYVRHSSFPKLSGDGEFAERSFSKDPRHVNHQRPEPPVRQH